MLRLDTVIQLVDANKQLVASRGLGQIDNCRIEITRAQPVQAHTFDGTFEFRTI